MAEVKIKISTQKRNAVASKQTMNLMYHETPVDYRKLVPAAALVVIALAVFLKFGFLDPMAAKSAANKELRAQQQTLDSMSARLNDYNELADLYGRYSYGWMTEEESSLVDRMEVLSILETVIDPFASIVNVALNGNVASVNISGLSLDQTSQLVHDLEALSLIKSATVYSVKSEDADLNAQVAMTIVLEKEA